MDSAPNSTMVESSWGSGLRKERDACITKTSVPEDKHPFFLFYQEKWFLEHKMPVSLRDLVQKTTSIEVVLTTMHHCNGTSLSQIDHVWKFTFIITIFCSA